VEEKKPAGAFGRRPVFFLLPSHFSRRINDKEIKKDACIYSQVDIFAVYFPHAVVIHNSQAKMTKIALFLRRGSKAQLSSVW
jgi:hypothetical protein